MKDEPNKNIVRSARTRLVLLFTLLVELAFIPISLIYYFYYHNGTQMDWVILNLCMIGLSIILMYMLSGYILNPISQALNREQTFFSNASHELRTPITAISMTADVALRTKKAKTDELRTALEQVYKSAQHTGNLINRMLELYKIENQLSKIEAYNLVINKFKFNLKDLVENICEDYKEQALSKNIQITVSSPKDGINIYSDRTMVKQLIYIYMDNALKYTPSAGVISLILINKHIKQLIISDTGIGIPAEELAKVREKFFRGQKARDISTGTGLSLALADKLAQALDIRTEISSAQGKGTQIKILFA